MNPLEQLLQQCTVKLSLPGQMGWGTGFFVAPGLILTCAHVVSRSLQHIQVEWQNQTLNAVLERSLPDPYDVALLRVTLPAEVNPPCVWLDEEVRSRDPLYLFGYPDEGDRQGEPRTFNCINPTGSGWILFNSGQVRPGMSGSPLLNQRTGKICGMVKFTRDRSSDLGGGAIPTRVILEQFPELRELQQEFHGGNHRWSDLLEPGLVEFQDLLTRIETGKATDADIQRLRGMLVGETSQVLQLGKYNINIGQGQNVQIGDRIYVEINEETVQAIVAAIRKASKNDPNVLRKIFQLTNLSPLINFYKGFRSEFSHLLRNPFFLNSVTSLGLFAVTLLIGTTAVKHYIRSPLEKTDISSLEKVEQAIRAGRRFQKWRLIVFFSNLESRIEEQLQKDLMAFADPPYLNGSEGIEVSPDGASIDSLDVSEEGNIIISNNLGYINYWEIKDNQQDLNNRWVNKESSIFHLNSDENLKVHAIRFSLDDSNTLISLTENRDKEKSINFYDLEKQRPERPCPVDNYEPPIIALDKLNVVLGIIKSKENHEILILSTRDCDSYKLSAQSGHLEDIEFWPRQNIEDPMILASASSEALMFWNATPPWKNSNEPLKIAITWKEDSSINESPDRIEIPDISKLSFSPDGKFLVTVNQEPNKVYMIRLWEIYVSGSQANPSVKIKEVDGFSPDNIVITSIDINNQGLLALGDKDGNLQLRSLQDRNHSNTFIEVRGESDRENSVKFLEFYPEGRVLISGGWDNRINLIDLSILSLSFDKLLDKGCAVLKEAVLQEKVSQVTYDEICPPPPALR